MYIVSMKLFFWELWQLFRQTFWDLIFIYKNVFHWWKSKLAIYLTSFLVGLFLFIPFFLLVFWIVYFSNDEWKIVMVGLLDYLPPVLIIFTIALFYSRFLLATLYLKYIERKKIRIKKNFIFRIKFIFKTLKLVGSALLFLILPVLLIWTIFLFTLSKLISQKGDAFIEWTSYFYALSFTLAGVILILSFWLLYFWYRILFSYLIFIENKKKGIISIIKRSFYLTSWYKKFLKFLIIMSAFMLPLFLINAVGQYINLQTENIRLYTGLKSKVWTKDPEKVLSHTKEVNARSTEFYAYSQLHILYSQYSEEELFWKYKKFYILELVYYIFYIWFFSGVLDVIVVSFYKRELLKKEKWKF